MKKLFILVFFALGSSFAFAKSNVSQESKIDFNKNDELKKSSTSSLKMVMAMVSFCGGKAVAIWYDNAIPGDLQTQADAYEANNITNCDHFV